MQPPSTLAATMSDKLFTRLAGFIEEQCGVKLTLSKKALLEGRLRRRLQACGMTGFDAYCGYLFTPQGMGQELPFMLDEVTTHKTNFFREPRHFELLRELVLTPMAGRSVRLWSAACSTGEEPWTLAMVAAEHGARYSVLGTDISSGVLREARAGVYSVDRLEGVQPSLRTRYFMRSKDPARRVVRIVPELRAQVEFQRLNLTADFVLAERMHAIFCRNVLIYFDARTRERVVERLYEALAPEGYLFTGHSETLSGHKVPLQYVAATVYRRRG